MKILYTVQRYGKEVVGGSEAAARAFAEQLASRGHAVEVVTSCARSYTDWANSYPPGSQELNGVVVHRLPVTDVRRPEKFGRLHQWMIEGPRPAPLFEQQRWAKHMGPDIAEYQAWLSSNLGRFDVAVFMTYLYATTTLGLPITAGRVPTVLQPTAHEEPPLRAGIFDSIFRLPDAYLFFTPEEREVIRERFSIDPYGEVIGMGIDMEAADGSAPFRKRFGLDESPYLLYVGRIDPSKGSSELHDFFVAYKNRRSKDLKLVLVGEQVSAVPPHPDIICTGFVDEDDKRRALAGSLALVQPSRFESFSIVACESWVQQRPVLIHRDCAVLNGQVRRSRGGIPYGGFADFEAAVDLLLAHPELASAMGLNGRRYVDERYRWPIVLDATERVLQQAVQRFGMRVEPTIRRSANRV